MPLPVADPTFDSLTVRLGAALLLLTAGTALASFGEMGFSWAGVSVMLLSEVR